MNQVLAALAQTHGIHFMGQPGADFQKKNGESALSLPMAMDAQPQLVTQSNSGIPAFLSTYLDPKIIEILVAPMKAAEIVGDEVKKGDWTTDTAMFPVVESTGEVSSYGDYNENGVAGANTNYPNRQSYTYQVMTQWGERELEKAALGRIDWANRLSIASVQALNKFQNKSYFFGVKGLENYGLFNDPSLLPSITPSIKAAGGVQWILADGTPNATALEVVSDIQKLFATLVNQGNGLIDRLTKMTLALSPTSDVAMTFTNNFNVNVADILKKNYPNMTIKSAPEYNTDSGEFVQLIADEIEAQRTASCAFTEKLRAHPIVVMPSSFKQKKSQGTWGTIIYRPIFIASMLGI
jgi:hypothetical protein